ncbi:MAG: formate dehydrogenase subunit alpha [Myxococcota bacterium]
MITVNGRPVPSGGTLLDACKHAGAHVPTFCSDEKLPAGGHCRACMVDVGGRLMPACTTPCRDGMEILTETETVRQYRRDLGELMVAESNPRGAVKAELEKWGVTGERYGRAKPSGIHDESAPYLRLDTDACIRCHLCVRACSDIQGQFVYSMQGRGAGAHLGWGNVPFNETDCVSCGACVASCPTEAITDVDHLRQAADPLRTVQTTCAYCGVGCQMTVHARGNNVVDIQGAPSPVNAGHLCVKGRYAHGFARHRDRLTTPLIRRDGRLVPATWSEAISYVASRMNALKGHVGGLSSSRCTNEENYLLQKWLRAVYATNNVDCCARVCHAPSAAGMRVALGTGAATNSLADIELADLLMVSGSNTTEAHPVTGARIKQAVLRGAKLLVVDPRRTELAELADVHLQTRPGTNVPLLNSMACALVEAGLVNREFIHARTDGWEAYEKFIRQWRPESAEAITGVPATLVRRAAELYGRARHPMQVHGLGMTEHYQGAEGVMLLCNLALLVGAIGRPGVGVNPLRGQNNVQGAADMGCQPDLLTGYQNPNDPQVRERFERVWARPIPTTKGLTIPRMYEAIRRGELRGLYIFGEDVVQTDPHAGLVAETLKQLDLLVVQEIFLSETAKLAHVVLPGASFLEKDGTFTNGERRVQRVRQILDPPGDARPDWRILCDLMAATGYAQPFRHPSEIMDEIALVNPAFRGISHARLERNGLQWPVPSMDHPGTPTLHATTFPIGKGRLSCVEYLPSPSLKDAGDKLMLITGRTLAHYNSGSMTRRTDNVRIREADLLEINDEDAARLGVDDGAQVRVHNENGEAIATACVTDRVQPGTLFMTFHFPESGANCVTTDVVDRLCDCPEYKLTPVTVEPLRDGR